MDMRLSERWSEAHSEGAADDAVDPQRLIALFIRRRRTVLAILVAVLTFALAAICLIPPRYTAQASVMLDPRQEKVVDAQQVLSGLAMDPTTVDSQVEVLKSASLAEAVVGDLHLDRDPEFAASRRPSPFGGAALSTVERVRRRLTVKRQGLTAVIGIGFTSTSPPKAASIANAFADRYLRNQREAKADAAARASDWLSTRLDGLRGQVEAADSAVQAYQATHGLMVAGDTGATITQQEISSLNTQYAAARAEQAEAEAKLSTARAQIAKGSNGGDLGDALSSNTISQLRQQRATLSGPTSRLRPRWPGAAPPPSAPVSARRRIRWRPPTPPRSRSTS